MAPTDPGAAPSRPRPGRLRRHRRRGGASASVILSIVAVLSACGGGSVTAAERVPFVPANFTVPGLGANPLLPLKPGTQWTRLGLTDVGHRQVPHQVTVTVTRVTRQVDGVTAITLLDQDVDAGQVAQYSVDYLAEDGAGNVWFMGSYTENYDAGRFTSVFDAWLSGVKGGVPGRLMPAQPRVGDKPFSIAQPPGDQPDVAQVVKQHQHECVPLRCFDDVLVVREGKASAPDNEYKYYVPGVGQVLNTPRKASRHHDLEKLVNVAVLSPEGLQQSDDKVLELDGHARVTKPDVFGVGTPAQRSL